MDRVYWIEHTVFASKRMILLQSRPQRFLSAAALFTVHSDLYRYQENCLSFYSISPESNGAISLETFFRGKTK